MRTLFATTLVTSPIACSVCHYASPRATKSARWVGPALLVAIAVAGCAGERTRLPITPPGEVGGAPVARRPIEAPVTPPPPASPGSPPAKGIPPTAIPRNALYVCVSDAGGRHQETAIEFAPKVAALCQRHPEMGPCQYERDICRRSGGRVFAASGQEITRQVEDEYDRKVLRVRFRAN